MLMAQFILKALKIKHLLLTLIWCINYNLRFSKLDLRATGACVTEMRKTSSHPYRSPFCQKERQFT